MWLLLIVWTIGWTATLQPWKAFAALNCSKFEEGVYVTSYDRSKQVTKHFSFARCLDALQIDEISTRYAASLPEDQRDDAKLSMWMTVEARYRDLWLQGYGLLLFYVAGLLAGPLAVAAVYGVGLWLFRGFFPLADG